MIMTSQPNQVPLVLVEQVEDPADAVQAHVEGVDINDRQVECLGGKYRVADSVGLMPLMRFAHAASQGIDTEDMEGLAAIYDMLQDCLHADDWPRFVREMTAKKAEADDMLPVVQQAIELLTARPTERPSESSAGSQPTSDTSTGGYSSPERPDRQGLTPVADLLASRG